MPENREVSVVVGLGRGGATTEAVYSGLGPNGEEWSKLDHLVYADGAYQAAWTTHSTEGLTIENNDGGTGLSNAQKVKWVYRNPTPSRDVGSDIPDIVVTSREIFVTNSSGTIVNVTPLYTEGTVASAGTAITGTGTAWTTHRIKPGMLMRVETAPAVFTAWIPITVVGGNTSITLESTTGVIGAGAAYEIRRCFGGNAKVDPGNESRNRIFCGVRNGDLFVAGDAVDGEFPAIIQVADVLSNSAITAANSTYILAQAVLTTAHPATAVIATLQNILGMQLADDGRVCIADFETTGSTARVKNRFRWSTATAPNNWTGDGANFTDVVGNSGIVTGLGRVSDHFSVHFTDGITLAVPTGSDSKPFDFRRTQAKLGAAVPEVLCQFFGGDLFVGSDYELYLFNGATATPVGGPTFQYEAASLGIDSELATRDASLGCWACGYEGATNSFHLFANWVATTPAADMGCHQVMVEVDQRKLYTFDWPIPITSMDWPYSTVRGYSVGFPSAWQVTSGLADSDPLVACIGLADDPRITNNATGFALPILKTGQSGFPRQRARTNWVDWGYPGYLKRLKQVRAWVVPEGINGPAGLEPESLQIRIESLPVEVNQKSVASATNTYPGAYTQTVLFRQVLNPGGATSDNAVYVPWTRISASVDPMSNDSTPPSVQIPVGETIRVTLQGQNGGSLDAIFGLYKLELVAEILGPMDPVDPTPA